MLPPPPRSTLFPYTTLFRSLSKEHYPQETELLRQVPGVGPLTSLTFVLTLEDPGRFEKSRSVGAYLGLVRSEEHTSELQSRLHLVCRLLLEKKKKNPQRTNT